jgi:hypothetical protein
MAMMEKQTAVLFLYEFVQLKLTDEQQAQFEGLFQQALEMEKKQIEKVFVDVTRATLQNIGIKSTLQDVIDFKKIAEVYYNEEFKSK